MENFIFLRAEKVLSFLLIWLTEFPAYVLTGTHGDPSLRAFDTHWETPQHFIWKLENLMLYILRCLCTWIFFCDNKSEECFQDLYSHRQLLIFHFLIRYFWKYRKMQPLEKSIKMYENSIYRMRKAVWWSKIERLTHSLCYLYGRVYSLIFISSLFFYSQFIFFLYFFFYLWVIHELLKNLNIFNHYSLFIINHY